MSTSAWCRAFQNMPCIWHSAWPGLYIPRSYDRSVNRQSGMLLLLPLAIRNFGMRSTFQSRPFPMDSGGLPGRLKRLYNCEQTERGRQCGMITALKFTINPSCSKAMKSAVPCATQLCLAQKARFLYFHIYTQHMHYFLASSAILYLRFTDLSAVYSKIAISALQVSRKHKTLFRMLTCPII